MLGPKETLALWTTVKLALATMMILLVVATPLAWWLATTRARVKPLIEAVVALPLVLPPTVLGFYLLVLLGPRGAIGAAFERAGGTHLAFTFAGILLASVIYSLPFAVQPLQDAFSGVGARMMEVAATLRARPIDRFVTVAVPLARRGFLTAAVLSFAHTLGEFGVVLMVGGNIPGRTQVASIAIYDSVEAFDYAAARTLSAILLGASFLILLVVYSINRRTRLVAP